MVAAEIDENPAPAMSEPLSTTTCESSLTRAPLAAIARTLESDVPLAVPAQWPVPVN